jgi:hypothetical protein
VALGISPENAGSAYLRASSPGDRVLETRVNRFAFQGEDAEDAFVNLAQWFVADEAFEPFYTERELPHREPSLGGYRSAGAGD